MRRGKSWVMNGVKSLSESEDLRTIEDGMSEGRRR